MEVSVIIPVYHARAHLEAAVRSALAQPEVCEVLLIEDGSLDGSLALCEALSLEDARVRVFTHPEHANLGAGASRNLGIRMATSAFLAFLDADDYYLPDRFAHTQILFENHPDADGVFESVGVQYQSQTLKAAHIERTHHEITGIRGHVSPELVFATLATGRKGHLHLNGFVIRRACITSELSFDTTLEQCQDSDWFLRIAARCRLVGGPVDTPVAIRRVHSGNRVLQRKKRIYFQRAYLKKCMDNQFYGSKDRYANAYLVSRYVSWANEGVMRRLGWLSGPLIIAATGCYLLCNPGLLLKLIKGN